jgi:hypothetical protein
MVPLPLPFGPEVMVIQVTVGLAVQEQLLAVVTVMVPVVLCGGIARFAGMSWYTQGAAAWLTLKLWPATTIFPLRETVFVLAATV